MESRPIVIRNSRFSWKKFPPWKPNKKTKITAICFNCEYEWDADILSVYADCPDCGAQIGSEDHVIRVEE